MAVVGLESTRAKYNYSSFIEGNFVDEQLFMYVNFSNPLK